MPKLQQVKRANGSFLHSVNLPLEEISEAGWKKGDELVIEAIHSGQCCKFVIYRTEDIKKEVI